MFTGSVEKIYIQHIHMFYLILFGLKGRDSAYGFWVGVREMKRCRTSYPHPNTG